MLEIAKKRIAITESQYNRLKDKAHYGQSMAGVIQELLDLADKIEGKTTEVKKDENKTQ